MPADGLRQILPEKISRHVPMAHCLAEKRVVVPEAAASGFVNPELDVPDVQSALAGAQDIIAEIMSEIGRAHV